MTSRIIHARISDRSILLSFHLVEKLSGSSDSDDPPPMSTAIVTALDYFLEKLVTTGVIPDIDPLIATEELDALIGFQREEEIETSIDSIALDMLDDFGDNDTKGLASDIADQSSAIPSNIEPRSDIEHSYDEAPQVLNPIAPWMESTIVRFDDLVKKSPKDNILEIAASGNTWNLRRAIECIYSNIPSELWGTEKASSLINEILPTLDPYITRDGIDLGLDGEIISINK